MFAGTLLALLTGCATTADRYVIRHCPVKRVYDEEAYRVVRDEIYYENGHVPIIGNCWRDSISVGYWCKGEGIDCKQRYEENHSWLEVDNKRIEYIDGVGLVAR